VDKVVTFFEKFVNLKTTMVYRSPKRLAQGLPGAGAILSFFLDAVDCTAS
jgi:hypothetical protein